MKILIIEDEHLIATSIKKGLEQEHYITDIAFDGLEGFDLASSGDYDLILLDLMLPGLDGLSICQKLRADNNHTPILMLTAKSQLEDKIKGLNSGADDYLTKPFAFEELLARIRALSRRPQKTTGKILSVGDLSLDTVNFLVKRGNKEIHLSNKDKDWFVYVPQLVSKLNGNAIEEKHKKIVGDGNWEYVPDSHFAEHCLKLKADNGNEMQISAFWCGYFEKLYSAEIVVGEDEELKINF